MERVRLSLWDTHHQSSLSSFLEMLLFVLVITYVHLLTLYADGSNFYKGNSSCLLSNTPADILEDSEN